MGEYATYKGQSIKIGTCEDMYYLRADQRHLVTAQSGNVDPVRNADAIRFRFPFPEEDHVAPGEFRDHGKSIDFHGVTVPEGVTHYSVQFKADAGYLVSLPCPESPEGRASDLKVHRNGFSGSVRLVQQRFWEGRLVAVARCGGCGAAYRMPELSDVDPILTELERMTKRARHDNDESRATYYEEVAHRIVAGYIVDHEAATV